MTDKEELPDYNALMATIHMCYQIINNMATALHGEKDDNSEHVLFFRTVLVNVTSNYLIQMSPDGKRESNLDTFTQNVRDHWKLVDKNIKNYKTKESH